MPEKIPDEMSLEELQKKQKSLKTVMGILGVIVILLASAGSYILGKNGSSVFALMPVVFLPFFMGIGTQLKKIRLELDRRNF